MELSKKTTILLSPELHRRLTQLAARRGTSLGDLVREACAAQYGVGDREAGEEAVRSLSAMALPVGTPAAMKQESVPAPDDLLP